MKLLVIVNQVAAKARAAAPKVQEKLSSARIDYDICETTRAGDATDKTRDALLSGVTTIAVVGGDGTLSEAAQGFFQFYSDLNKLPAPVNSRASLAILPAGTGDDFARGLMGSRASVDRWIEILIEHCRGKEQTTKSCDLLYGRCDNYAAPFICLNASTMGIGGETAARVAAQGPMLRRCSGEMRFALAAARGLIAWRERRVRITVDEQSYEAEMNLAAVANGLYAGGGMMLSPDAKVDDGKLDVVTASGLGRASILRELGRIHKGGHIANPKVRITQGRSVRIATFKTEDAMLIEADGNVRGLTPVSFEVMPAALRFVFGS